MQQLLQYFVDKRLLNLENLQSFCLHICACLTHTHLLTSLCYKY